MSLVLQCVDLTSVCVCVCAGVQQAGDVSDVTLC